MKCMILHLPAKISEDSSHWHECTIEGSDVPFDFLITIAVIKKMLVFIFLNRFGMLEVGIGALRTGKK
jgi:hypothetical protein